LGIIPTTETLLPFLVDLWLHQTCRVWQRNPPTFEEGKKKKAAKDPNRPKKPTGGAYGALAALASPKFGPFRFFAASRRKHPPG